MEKLNNKTLFFRIWVKVLILFLLFNVIFAVIYRRIPYGKITLYNHLIPGRERFPYGENARLSYNLTINNIDALFASHIVNAQSNLSDRYRVFIIGDSSIWGTLLMPDETLPSQIGMYLQKRFENKKIQVFNLGYPAMSLMKDLIILDNSLQFNPDLIIWAVTLESFPKKSQLEHPIVKQNSHLVNELISKYELDLDSLPEEINIFNNSIIGQRRNLADLIRLQFYGFIWAATEVDQFYPTSFTPALRDLEKDYRFKEFELNQLKDSDLSFNVIENFVNKNPHIKVVIINEPILISNGSNSDVRYNYYYPRWAYDAYLDIMNEHMMENGIEYYDLWDLIPEMYFTNTAIHLSPEAIAIYASSIVDNLNDYLMEILE